MFVQTIPFCFKGKSKSVEKTLVRAYDQPAPVVYLTDSDKQEEEDHLAAKKSSTGFKHARSRILIQITLLVSVVVILSGIGTFFLLRSSQQHIVDESIDRLKSVGDPESQRKEGVAISAETIRAVRDCDGVRGVHILSGGNEKSLPEILEQSGL